MGISGHRQNLDVSVGKLHQASGVVSEPQIIVLAPLTLGRKQEGNLPGWLGVIVL